MIIVLKKKLLITILCIILCLGVAGGVTVACLKTETPKSQITVVLDAGHGGIDGGVVGVVSKTPESELNLIITKKVQKLLENQQVNVVLTRETSDGLYGELTDGFKKRDMQKRRQIIKDANPTLIVSIHGNKYPSSDRRGAQAFYEKNNNSSKELSKAVQNSLNVLNKEYINKTYDSLSGDYYILKCGNYPSTIVEYGFLSNNDDDMLLNTEEYQNKVANAVFRGIIAYLNGEV